MVDEFIDRFKDRRLVQNERAAERLNDMFFDSDGTKWLCVIEDRQPNRLVLEFDEIEPVTALKILKAIVVRFFGIGLVVGSIAVPIYWFFWGTS